MTGFAAPRSRPSVLRAAPRERGAERPAGGETETSREPIPPARGAGRAPDASAAPSLLAPLPEQHLQTCRSIGDLFDRARDVVLTTHVNPDGDGLGSEAALGAYLRARGVRARILNPDPPPRQFEFLGTAEVPLGVYRGYEEDALGGADALVVLDTGVAARLGRLAEALPALPAVRVCIDHHAPREALAALALVDPTASSTAELVYRLLVALGAEIGPDVATPLLVGIAFDTGSFRYANTTPEAHLIAADLYRRGVDAGALYTKMFATQSAARVRLWGLALSRLAVEEDGRLAWVAVDRDLLAAAGATSEDLDGLVEQGRMIGGVRLSILFREDAPDRTKVSLRSNGAVDVNELAGRFGGGGHRNAAGATLPLPIREAVGAVLAEARPAVGEA